MGTPASWTLHTYWLTSRPPSHAGDWRPLSFSPCRHCERVTGMSDSPSSHQCTHREPPFATLDTRATSAGQPLLLRLLHLLDYPCSNSCLLLCAYE